MATGPRSTPPHGLLQRVERPRAQAERARVARVPIGTAAAARLLMRSRAKPTRGRASVAGHGGRPLVREGRNGRHTLASAGTPRMFVCKACVVCVERSQRPAGPLGARQATCLVHRLHGTDMLCNRHVMAWTCVVVLLRPNVESSTGRA